MFFCVSAAGWTWQLWEYARHSRYRFSLVSHLLWMLESRSALSCIYTLVYFLVLMLAFAVASAVSDHALGRLLAYPISVSFTFPIPRHQKDLPR